MLDISIQSEAMGALRDAGLLVDSVEFDAGLRRVPTLDKPRSKNGAYIAHSDAPTSIWWHNWATGESSTWTAKGQSRLTASEKATLARRIEQARKIAEDEQGKRYAEAAKKAHDIYNAAADCHEHAYLVAKGIKAATGIKKYRDALAVPIYAEHGTLTSLQFIGADGSKRFLSGGRKYGCYFHIGGKEPGNPLIICEGLATGLSLYESISWPVLVAFDAGNLLPVSKFARSRYKDREIILAADNDTKTPGNPGVTKATEAAQAIGGSLAVPDQEGDFNDLHQSKGLEEVKRQLAARLKCDEIGNTGESDPDESVDNNILPPPPPVPLDAFPVPVAAMLEEAAEAFPVPLQIATTSFLAFLSCLVGRSRLISAKAGWVEGGNLWLASVAPSGMGKTPCMAAFFKPITRLEYEAKREFDEAFEAYEAERDFYQAQRNNQIRAKAKGKEVNVAELHKPEEPKQRQATADDVTIEALGDILRDNPKGVLWLKDELAGMLFDMDKYSNGAKGGTKARLLSSHSLERWKTARASDTGRNIYIPRACVSIFGGIQPGVMKKVFEAGAGGIDEESGFLPRFLFIRAIPEAPAYWSERTFSSGSMQLLDHIAAALWPWDIERDDQGHEIDKITQVSREAKGLYTAWYNAIAGEAFIAENSALLRKLQAHALRICLLLHCLDAALAGTDGMAPVSSDCMRRALLLADWAKDHQAQCWRLFPSGGKEAKQASPIELAMMTVIVEHAAKIEADGWRIKFAELHALIESKMGMHGLKKDIVAKVATVLGLGLCYLGRSRARSIPGDKVATFKKILTLQKTGVAGVAGVARPTPATISAEKTAVAQVLSGVALDGPTTPCATPDNTYATPAKTSKTIVAVGQTTPTTPATPVFGENNIFLSDTHGEQGDDKVEL